MRAELEQKLTEAREHFRKVKHEAFMCLSAYRHYWGKVDRIREEWLGLCEIMKSCNHKNCGHLVGLILLKERMHDKYRDVRLHCLRLKAKYREAFLEAYSAHWRVHRLKRQLKNSKEDELCAEM